MRVNKGRFLASAARGANGLRRGFAPTVTKRPHRYLWYMGAFDMDVGIAGEIAKVSHKFTPEARC